MTKGLLMIKDLLMINVHLMIKDHLMINDHLMIKDHLMDNKVDIKILKVTNMNKDMDQHILLKTLSLVMALNLDIHKILDIPGYSQNSGYPQQSAYSSSQQSGYTHQPGGNQKIPESAHEHRLTQETSNEICKVCQDPIEGTQAYVCHECPLVLCYNCANAIFFGNKQRQIHPHLLALRLTNNWACDLCKQYYKDTASFYCKSCNFNSCSKCYVGF